MASLKILTENLELEFCSRITSEQFNPVLNEGDAIQISRMLGHGILDRECLCMWPHRDELSSGMQIVGQAKDGSTLEGKSLGSLTDFFTTSQHKLALSWTFKGARCRLCDI
jgi:hypothetical protein